MELVTQRSLDAAPGPVVLVFFRNVRIQQFPAQLPKGVAVVVVRQAEREIQRLVGILQLERIVAIQVIAGGEEIE